MTSLQASVDARSRIDKYSKLIFRLNKNVRFKVKTNKGVEEAGLTSKASNDIENIKFRDLHFVIYSKWIERFDDYKVERVSSSILRLSDESGQKSVHEYLLFFKNKLISKIIERSPIGTTSIEINYKKRGQKFYISKLSSKTYHGRQVRKSEIDYSYARLSKNQLPISVKKRVFYKVLASGTSKESERISSEHSDFSDYKTF